MLKDGFIEMVPATVPVWKRAEVELSLNTACVVFAGIRKLTVRVPFANNTAGSATVLLPVTVSVNLR